MPELPEVETTKRVIEPVVKNRKIKNINIYRASLRWPIPKHLPQTLTNQKFTNIERRAKYLLLGTSSGTLIVHLGMTGCLKSLKKNKPQICTI